VLAQNLEGQVREIRKKFDERIQQEIVKVTSDDIAEALTKRVLTVRTGPHGNPWRERRRGYSPSVAGRDSSKQAFLKGGGNHRQRESQNGSQLR
jgi:hypothetical protein